MATKTYTVHRSMHGDGRDYEPGDTRELDEIDAAALVESGALSLEGEDPRVREPAVRNTFGKAEPTGHLATVNATSDERAPGARGRAKAAVAAPEPAASA
jgi:hypothetical protein